MQLAAVGDQVVVIQGVTYGSDNERVIYGVHGNHSVIIEGSVISALHGAMELYVGSNEVTIGAAGSVRSSGTVGGFANLSLFGDNNTLLSQGAISSGAGIAAMIFGSTGTVVNSGTISGDEIGLYLTNGNSYKVTNSGTIEGSGNFVGAFSQGGIVASGEAILIDNSGVVRANGFGGNAIDLSGGGTGVIGPSLVHNTGSIVSLNGIGVEFQFYGAGNTVRVENFGLIRGGTIAISASDVANVVVNAGMIDGDVILRDGADLYDGIGGVVFGVIDGGAGDDVFRISDQLAQLLELAAGGTDRVEATVSWDLSPTPEFEHLTLLGAAAIDGTGNARGNVLRGNGGDNRLFGLAGNDIVYGGVGDDLLDGGANNDKAYGGTGDDLLRGRDGNDSLDGGSDEDRLLGGLGLDTLDGGDGDDTLSGGAGQDGLTGGAGSDVFQFVRLVDSGTGLGARDSIADFAVGADLIDLAGLDANAGLAGDQAFTFIGAAAFSAVAGQLRLSISGVDGLLDADVDGNGITDFRIVLTGVTLLTAADFIL